MKRALLIIAMGKEAQMRTVSANQDLGLLKINNANCVALLH